MLWHWHWQCFCCCLACFTLEFQLLLLPSAIRAFSGKEISIPLKSGDGTDLLQQNLLIEASHLAKLLLIRRKQCCNISVVLVAPFWALHVAFHLAPTRSVAPPLSPAVAPTSGNDPASAFATVLCCTTHHAPFIWTLLLLHHHSLPPLHLLCVALCIMLLSFSPYFCCTTTLCTHLMYCHGWANVKILKNQELLIHCLLTGLTKFQVTRSNVYNLFYHVTMTVFQAVVKWETKSAMGEELHDKDCPQWNYWTSLFIQMSIWNKYTYTRPAPSSFPKVYHAAEDAKKHKTSNTSMKMPCDLAWWKFAHCEFLLWPQSLSNAFLVRYDIPPWTFNIVGMAYMNIYMKSQINW